MIKIFKFIGDTLPKLKVTMQIVTIISNGIVDIAEKVSQVDINGDGKIGKNTTDDIL